MHPYLPHLLEDIKNAQRPGYPTNSPLFSNYEPDESNVPDDEKWSDETEGDGESPSEPVEDASLGEEINPLYPSFEDDDLTDEDLDDYLDETFEEVEQFVSGEPPRACFGDHCGLKVSDFPPAGQLTEDDMNAVIKAYRKMGTTWNIDFAFPEKLPVELHYNILVNTLNENIMIMKNGFIGMDYCSGCPEGCKFGEYCSCLKYWQEEDSEKSQNPNA